MSRFRKVCGLLLAMVSSSAADAVSSRIHAAPLYLDPFGELRTRSVAGAGGEIRLEVRQLDRGGCTDGGSEGNRAGREHADRQGRLPT